MGPWMFCWPVVADSHQFDEEPTPHPHQCGKSDPYSDPKKSDLDPHESEQPEAAACRY